MNLLYYLLCRKKQIYNQKHHYQQWIPTQESRKTHTHFQTLVFFSKKKNWKQKPSIQFNKQLLSIVLNIQRWIKHDPLLSETHSFTGKARK